MRELGAVGTAGAPPVGAAAVGAAACGGGSGSLLTDGGAGKPKTSRTAGNAASAIAA